MSTKLTLQIDDEVIKSAKRFAKNNHTSLSKLAENYFRILAQEEAANTTQIPGVVGELAGILKGKGIEDSQSDYIDYLERKYS